MLSLPHQISRSFESKHDARLLCLYLPASNITFLRTCRQGPYRPVSSERTVKNWVLNVQLLTQNNVFFVPSSPPDGHKSCQLLQKLAETSLKTSRTKFSTALMCE